MGKGYNPNQPRWSKGSETGGEWKAGGPRSDAAAGAAWYAAHKPGVEHNLAGVQPQDKSYKSASPPPVTQKPTPVTKPVTPKSPFITDFGKTLDVTDAKTGKVVMKLSRYGVWAYDQAKGKHQVAKTGNNLNTLMKRYGVTMDRVAKVKS
jgi:hypothetical protein